MWDKIRPYVRSVFAIVVAVTVGVAGGSFLPPNRADISAAYREGYSDAKTAAEEVFSSQLAAEHQQADERLASALDGQEGDFSADIEEAVRSASSAAFQEGQSAGEKKVFDALQMENPYTGTIIRTVDDYNDYVSTYQKESAAEQEDDRPAEETPVPTPAPTETPVQVYQPIETEYMVWIPNSGSKYHSNPNCSGMKNPQKVSQAQAEAMGYEPCKKCYG